MKANKNVFGLFIDVCIGYGFQMKNDALLEFKGERYRIWFGHINSNGNFKLAW